MTIGLLALQFLPCALLIAVAGYVLCQSADRIAKASGLTGGWIGLALLATVTTLPEMAVTLSALRLRALDMAIGNLLGSNLFNVAILAIDDIFYTRGPLLADASPVHGGTAIAAVVMSGLVMIGLVMRPQGRELRVLSWVSAGLLATYLFNAALVFLYGGG
ncbi:MAG: hypothetical protein ABIX00_07770 [Polaromonas sp.]